MYSVYALVDPRTNEVRYIGCTKDIATRFKSHMGNGGANDNRREWISELREQGLQPVLSILESGLQKASVFEREQHWIRHHLEQGNDLLNLTVFDPGKPKTNILQHVVVVTQSQYERYKRLGKDVDLADFSVIRKGRHENRSYFSLVDLIAALQISTPSTYWSVLKLRLKNEELENALDEIAQLKLKAPDGRLRLTDCAKRESIIKILLDIPNRDIKPVQQWFVQMLVEKPEEIVRIFPD